MEPVALGGFPFDSQITGYQPDGLPIYDRASNSEEFASLIKGFWRDGVFGTDALTVLVGSGMTATVGTGSVLVQGRVAKITSPKTVNFETANSQPRFDIVVARRDLSNAVRDIVLDVVKGVPASTPVAPSPVRNATIWELCLAIVKIPANVGMVQQQNITDTRLDKNLCGIVAATMTDVDTSRFYEQIQSDLSSFREEEQAQFEFWFDSLRDILDENAAGNLYNKIESLTAADVGALPTNGTAADASKLGGKESAYYLNLANVVPDGAGAHNATYRGKNLGTAVTAEQYAAIADGTFRDLFIADYWTIGGVNYRIAAFDFYYNTGDTACTTHHVTLVPDANMYSHVMNNTNVTTGAYVGSKMYTEGLNLAKETINDAFGSAHILKHRQFLQNAVTNGYASGGSWYDSSVELMTEQNVYGCKVFSNVSCGTALPNSYTVDKSQFPLFAFRPDLISNRMSYWLRDVVSAAYFAIVTYHGYAYCYDASYAGGVRPAFSIIG